VRLGDVDRGEKENINQKLGIKERLWRRLGDPQNRKLQRMKGSVNLMGKRGICGVGVEGGENCRC